MDTSGDESPKFVVDWRGREGRSDLCGIIVDELLVVLSGKRKAPAVVPPRLVRVEIWAFARRSPFVPWAGFDLLSLPPIGGRRATWLPPIVDQLGLKKQHWRFAGRKRPIDS
jgi:hypothetical protein